MQTNFEDRLLLIMRYLKCKSQRSFAPKIGITHSKLQSYLRGSSPSIDVLNTILLNLDYINPAWLLTGEGEMLKNSAEKTENKASDNEFEKKYCRLLEEKDELWKKCMELQDENKVLLKKIGDFQDKGLSSMPIITSGDVEYKHPKKAKLNVAEQQAEFEKKRNK